MKRVPLATDSDAEIKSGLITRGSSGDLFYFYPVIHGLLRLDGVSRLPSILLTWPFNSYIRSRTAHTSV